MSHPPIIPPLAAHGRLACTEPELVAWGESFGRVAAPPLVVTVSGELGAGKTTLVRAICRGYGVREDVTSPTFTIVHQYAAPRSPVYHVDLYRLGDPRDLTNLGWDEMLADEAVVLIEWPEHAGDRIPHVHVPISLQHLPDEADRRLLYAGGHV
jgi:tRNA threonylcarbamoyladenosine biosynthesis protein TsaE